MTEAPTTKMIFNMVYDMEPDVTPLGNRTIWVPSGHLDSKSVEVTMEYRQHGTPLALAA